MSDSADRRPSYISSKTLAAELMISESTAYDDDTPMTLAEACTIVFRDIIKPGTLRAEARRGRLTIERIGRRDFVTRAALKEMRELCRTPRAALMSIDQAMPDPNRAKRSIEGALASAVALRQRSKPAGPSKAVAHRVRPKSAISAVVNPLAKTKRRPKARQAKTDEDLPTAGRPNVYTPGSLAERWACSERHIRNMVKRGDIPSFQSGGKLLRIRTVDVEAYESGGIAPPDQDGR